MTELAGIAYNRALNASEFHWHDVREELRSHSVGHEQRITAPALPDELLCRFRVYYYPIRKRTQLPIRLLQGDPRASRELGMRGEIVERVYNHADLLSVTNERYCHRVAQPHQAFVSARNLPERLEGRRIALAPVGSHQPQMKAPRDKAELWS